MSSVLPGLSSAIRLHPMLVHFPIAFWVAASAVWGYALFASSSVSWKTGLWLHTAGAVTALAAVAAGYLSTSLMGHDAPGHDQVHVHRDIMLWATGLSIVVTSLGWWRQRRLAIRGEWLVLLSVLQSGVMTVGADRGAVLVYKLGVGVTGTSAPDSGHQNTSHGSH